MFPRPLYIPLLISGIVLSFRRTLASYSTRSVRLLPPRGASGNVLAVTSRDDKASAMSSYEVVQEAGTSFDEFQVWRVLYGVLVESMLMVKKRQVRLSSLDALYS